MLGAISIGIFPLLLLCFSVIRGEREQILGMNGLVFGLLLVGAGFLAYALKLLLGGRGTLADAEGIGKAA
jgi:hypothetical protein